MTINRYAARTDANQSGIIAALEAAGASVEVIRLPLDLLIGYSGKWLLMEVKVSAAAARANTPVTKRQRAFAERHPNGGPIATVWDVEGALRALATMRQG